MIGCTIFAAVSGSSAATCSTIGHPAVLHDCADPGRGVVFHPHDGRHRPAAPLGRVDRRVPPEPGSAAVCTEAVALIWLFPGSVTALPQKIG